MPTNILIILSLNVFLLEAMFQRVMKHEGAYMLQRALQMEEVLQGRLVEDLETLPIHHLEQTIIERYGLLMTIRGALDLLE